MSALHSEARVTEWSSFDMWRDYMDLSRTLEQLRVRGEAERLAAIQAPRRAREGDTLSVGSSPVSSLSDTGSSSSPSRGDHCHFCRQNGESPRVYLSHRLKTEDGSKVTCPILRRYTCPACDATGDQAHTLRYCPQPNGKAAAGKLMPVFW